MRYIGIDPASGLPLEVATEEDRILSIKHMDVAGKALPYISRGFIDLQVNGYRGRDYSAANLDSTAILGIVEDLAASGTTQHVATLVTNSQGRLVKNLRAIAEARRTSPLAASAIVGCHVEGPFIASEDGPRGAHDLRYVRDPDFQEFLEWQEASDGLVRIVTVAPEREGALDFIERIVEAGVVAAIGHTGATPERIRDAISAGARLSTHLGNGSHASIPRLVNYIWEQLAADELTAGIISDGFHLPPSVVKTFARAKGLERLVLVSDVIPPAGYGRGRHKWGDLDVEIFEDGHIGVFGTPFLAGAAELLDWDIPAFMRYTGCGLAEAVRLCTVNAARTIMADASAGTLMTGSAVNLVLFNYTAGESRLGIVKTVINGTEIAGKGSP
jgi:N-acetylglucosamine-6-phosphate deacetylase